MVGWILFAIGWITCDFIVKFLLDSVERIFRDDINSRIKQLPVKIKDMSTTITMTGRNRFLIVLLEAERILAIIFFLPFFLLLALVPFLRRTRYCRMQFQFFQTLFSRDWMEVALVLMEAFRWKGLLLSILCVFQVNSFGQADASFTSTELR